jgi:Fur family zinc uptake transcriptional regulator
MVIDRSRILKRCSEEGKSVTPQRIMILEELTNHNDHPTAYQLQFILKKNGHSINISTIYRVLDFWIEMRFIHKAESNNTYVVCPDPHSNHLHVLLHCSGCSRIAERCKTSSQLATPEDLNFFTTEGQVVELQGLCNNCVVTN